MSKLFDKLQAYAKISVERVQSETHDATVVDIVQAPSVKDKNGVEHKKVRVITKEFGSLWCFESNVQGALQNYGEGTKAKITIVPNKYKDATGAEVEGFNLQRVVVQALDAKQLAAIQAMPKGTALFATL